MTKRDDDALWTAYAETRYLVWPHGKDGGVMFELREGVLDPNFDLLIEDEAIPGGDWALVTAWNPDSQLLPEPENRRRQDELERIINTIRLRYWPARGESPDGKWSEDSVLILGASREVAAGLGRRFGQKAVLIGRVGEPAELVRCSSGR